MASQKNNYKFTLREKITIASGIGASFLISKDLEQNQTVEVSNASIIFMDGEKIERFIGTCAGDYFTIVLRGLEQGDTNVANAALKQDWAAGSEAFVTTFAGDMLDVSSPDPRTITTPLVLDNVSFTATGKFGLPTYASEATRDAAIPAPINGMWIYRSDLGLPQKRIGGAWVDDLTGSLGPNLSLTTLGKAKWASTVQFLAGTDLDSGDPLVPRNSDIKDALAIVNASISQGASKITSTNYYPGEAITAGRFVFLENQTTFALSTTVQNIGDITNNTRVAFPIFGNGVNFTTLKLALRKFVSPAVDLGVRIETDTSGAPSGTPVTNGTATITSASLTTSLVDTTVTFGGNVNLAAGQIYWVVLFAGTYGSETINATNYFGLGYNASFHTTTRFTSRRNATVWSSSHSFMTYVSCSGALNILLSLTDADYTYKSDWFGVSDNTVAIGTKPNIGLPGGINVAQSGLTYGTKYYLSSTPGLITTAVNNYGYPVGDALSATEIITYKVPGLFNTIATLNTSQTGSGTSTSASFLADKNYFATFSTTPGNGVTMTIQCSYDNATWVTLSTITSNNAVPTNHMMSAYMIKGYYYRTLNVQSSGGVLTSTITMTSMTAI